MKKISFQGSESKVFLYKLKKLISLEWKPRFRKASFQNGPSLFQRSSLRFLFLDHSFKSHLLNLNISQYWQTAPVKWEGIFILQTIFWTQVNQYKRLFYRSEKVTTCFLVFPIIHLFQDHEAGKVPAPSPLRFPHWVPSPSFCTTWKESNAKQQPLIKQSCNEHTSFIWIKV